MSVEAGEAKPIWTNLDEESEEMVLTALAGVSTPVL